MTFEIPKHLFDHKMFCLYTLNLRYLLIIDKSKIHVIVIYFGKDLTNLRLNLKFTKFSQPKIVF